MRRTLRKLLTGSVIAAASVLPMEKAEAQKDNPSLSVSSDLANSSRFWGFPFLDTPHYRQTINMDYKDLSISLVAHADVKQKQVFDIDTHVSYSHPLSNTFSAYGGGLEFDK